MSRVVMNLAAAQLNVGEKGIMDFSGEAMHLEDAKVPEYTQQAFLTQQYENVMEMNQMEQTQEVEMDNYIPHRTNIEHDGIDR